MIGTPRKLSIGGCAAGKPYDCGWAPTRFSRSGRESETSTPRTPRPRGKSPIARCVAGSMPRVTKRSRPVRRSSSTPIAAYRAPVRSVAAPKRFCRTPSRSRWATSDRPASSRRRSVASSSARSSSIGRSGTSTRCYAPVGCARAAPKRAGFPPHATYSSRGGPAPSDLGWTPWPRVRQSRSSSAVAAWRDWRRCWHCGNWLRTASRSSCSLLSATSPTAR